MCSNIYSLQYEKKSQLWIKKKLSVNFDVVLKITTMQNFFFKHTYFPPNTLPNSIICWKFNFMKIKTIPKRRNDETKPTYISLWDSLQNKPNLILSTMDGECFWHIYHNRKHSTVYDYYNILKVNTEMTRIKLKHILEHLLYSMIFFPLNS